MDFEEILEIKRKGRYKLLFERESKKMYVLEENGEKSMYPFDPKNEFLIKIILEEEFLGNKEKMIEFFEIFNKEIANEIREVLRWV